MEREALIRVLRDIDQHIPEGAFYAPQFYIVRGSEMGYHCHLFKTIRDLDTGVLLTLRSDEEVFAEVHRRGRVKRPVNIQSIPPRERQNIVGMVRDSLAHIPLEARRRPSNRALLI